MVLLVVEHCKLNDMNLVKVTANQRSGKAYAKDMLINLDKVAEPIIENTSNNAIVVIDESTKLQSAISQGNNNVQYILDESLAVFVGLSSNLMFVGTVVKRNNRNPVVVSQGFITKNIVGTIVDTPDGSEFLYEEEGGSTPVKYVVSESIADIETALS